MTEAIDIVELSREYERSKREVETLHKRRRSINKLAGSIEMQIQAAENRRSALSDALWEAAQKVGQQ